MRIKYEQVIKDTAFEDYCNNYLVGRVFKVLPLKEEGYDWESYLYSLNKELVGASHLLLNDKFFLALVTKLEGLNYIESHDQFRKTVLECTSFTKRLPSLIGDVQ